MKWFKKILFILFLFSITGCSINYTLDISSNKKVNEIISLDYKKVKLNSNDLNNIITDYKTSDIYKKYYVTNTGNTEYKGNYVYDSIDELKENSVYTKNIEYESTNNNFTIKFTGDLGDYFLLGEGASATLISEVNFNIKSPFKVSECNGKKIGKNSCSWQFNENDYIKDIYIKYDTDSISSTSKYIFIGLVGLIVMGIFILINFINKSKRVNRI